MLSMSDKTMESDERRTLVSMTEYILGKCAEQVVHTIVSSQHMMSETYTEQTVRVVSGINLKYKYILTTYNLTYYLPLKTMYSNNSSTTEHVCRHKTEINKQ
jgi:hypothetical protein